MSPTDPEGRLQVSIENRSEELQRLHQIVEEFAQVKELPATVLCAVDLVLEEVVTNVIKHAFESTGVHTIDVAVTTLPGEVVVSVEDEGRPFDPVTASELAASSPAENFGLHLVRDVAQMLSYRRENGRNLLSVHLGMPSE